MHVKSITFYPWISETWTESPWAGLKIQIAGVRQNNLARLFKDRVRDYPNHRDVYTARKMIPNYLSMGRGSANRMPPMANIPGLSYSLQDDLGRRVSAPIWIRQGYQYNARLMIWYRWRSSSCGVGVKALERDAGRLENVVESLSVIRNGVAPPGKVAWVIFETRFQQERHGLNKDTRLHLLQRESQCMTTARTWWSSQTLLTFWKILEECEMRRLKLNCWFWDIAWVRQSRNLHAPYIKLCRPMMQATSTVPEMGHNGSQTVT